MQQASGNEGSTRPVARFAQLVVTETADEVLLYETEKHHIHKLNATTAAVWRHCDGQHGVVALVRAASRDLGQDVDEATVRLALTQLNDAGLLEQALGDEVRMSRLSRRTFMQRAGVAGAIAVPAIVSTTAAVAAQSPGECGGTCGGFLDLTTIPWAIQYVYPCVDQCTECPWEYAFGPACAAAFGTSEITICGIGVCTETQGFAAARTVPGGGLPSEQQLLDYAREVYPELFEDNDTGSGDRDGDQNTGGGEEQNAGGGEEQNTGGGEEQNTGGGEEQNTGGGEEQNTGGGEEQNTGGGEEQNTGGGEEQNTGGGADLVVTDGSEEPPSDGDESAKHQG